MDVLPEFEYLRPKTVAEATILGNAHGGSRIVAGGTDLMANLRRGIGTPGALIDITGIEGLSTIERTEDALIIGAGVTLADLAADERVIRDFPMIATAASAVAGSTHRNAATVGGNLCQDTRCVYYNQSQWWRKSNDGCLKYEGTVCHVASGGDRCWAAYCGDLAPALMVLGAEVEIEGPAGRRMALIDLFEDDGQAHLTLAEHDFIGAVHVPMNDGIKAGYAKTQVRGAIDFPLAGVAVALRRDGGKLCDLRVALTGTNCCPVMIEDAGSLIGKPLDEAALEDLGRMVKRRIQPMNSSFTSHQYRGRVAVNLATRLTRQLYEG